MQTKQITCLNGRYVLASRAAVSVADRGFRYGDGVFETVRVEKAVPYQWAAHMARLQQGLQALGITPPVTDFRPYVEALLRRNAAQNGFLRLAVTRGAGSRGYAPYPPGMPANWIIEWTEGLHEISAPCTLWLSALSKIPPQCLPTAHKLAHGVNNTLAMIEAQQHRADEALQLSTDGFISEASSANIFWFHHGVLFTPALETGCIGGTTREAVLRLTPWPVRVVNEGLASLQQAAAVFLTNSRVGIWPVERLQPMGWNFSTTHPVHRQLQGLLKADRVRDRSRWNRA